MSDGHPPTGPGRRTPAVGHDTASRYEIRVRGHLGSHPAPWFDGLELVDEDDGTTVIRGSVVDQAALHGLLTRFRDLGIPLVSLTELPVPSASVGHRPSSPRSTTTPGAPR